MDKMTNKKKISEWEPRFDFFFVLPQQLGCPMQKFSQKKIPFCVSRLFQCSQFTTFSTSNGDLKRPQELSSSRAEVTFGGSLSYNNITLFSAVQYYFGRQVLIYICVASSSVLLNIKIVKIL
jgi:hypothetical protein